jgi:restriction endonuclease S subunit
MPQLEERIDLLEKSVAELDNTLGALIQAIPAIEKNSEDAKPRRSAIDTLWECSGCGARLGIYNKQSNELRVRYKDFLIYVIPGSGGSTRIPCRRCGNMNVIEDDGQ